MSKHLLADKAERYARNVIAGKVVACEYVKLACKRHLNDLKRSTRKSFPYRYDAEKADRYLRFLSKLPHTKGQWAARRETIKLEPWQCFVYGVPFGWVKKKSEKRRFRRIYIEVPRKSAKSIIGAGTGLFCLAADGEHGAEVFSGATTEKQAKEVFTPARLMALRTPDLTEFYGLTVNASNLHIESNGSRFEPIIGKPGDGASPHCAIVDEYHEHTSDVLVETMETGMGAREQPLLFIITTAGSDIAGPCYAQRKEVIDVLKGSLKNEHLWGVIYTIDEGDDWTSELALRKANPNFDVSVSGEWLKAQQQEAIQSSRKQNAFKTKHLNIWVTAREGWMNMEDWKRCGDKSLTPDHLKGEAAFAALDLSAKYDIASGGLVFRKEYDGVPHFFIFTRNYLPEGQIQDPAKRHYQAWMHDGHLIATDGDIIDYEKIETDVMAWDDEFSLRELGFDPWGATQLAQNLQAQGITCVEIAQRTQNFSEPMKMFEAYTKSGQIHHDDNPVLNWAIGNVVVKADANENIYPRKERLENKIDPAVAVIMAFARALLMEPKKQSVYESRGVVFV